MNKTTVVYPHMEYYTETKRNQKNWNKNNTNEFQNHLYA